MTQEKQKLGKSGGIAIVGVAVFILLALIVIFAWGNAKEDEIADEAQEFIDAGCTPAADDFKGHVTMWNCPPGTPDSVGQ
jgi:hypothetical protein